MEDYRLGGMIIVRIGCRVFSDCEGREAGWIVGLEQSHPPLLGPSRALEDTHER